MSSLDKYRRRVTRNGVDNVGKAFEENTIAFRESTFHASPTFRVIDVLNTELNTIEKMDARVVEVERMGSLREILFRPRQGLNVGTYVTFDGDTWIIFDKWGSVEAANISVMAQKCNRKIKWYDGSNTLQSFDCVASATPLGSKANQGRNDIEWNKFDVRLPLGQLFVFVELNSATDRIDLNYRFVFGTKVYEVFGVDDTTYIDKDGKGILQLTVKVSTIQHEDDFTNGIAHNNIDADSANGLDAPNTDDENGGRLW